MNEHGQAITILLRLQRWGWALFLVPALVVAVIVGVSVRSTVIDGFALVIADGIGGIAASILDAPDVTGSLPEDKYDELNRVITVRLERGVLSGLRIIDTEGVVVYSTDADEVGSDSKVCRVEQGALVGDVVVQMVNGRPMSTADGELLKVCAPLILPGSDDPVGAITVFKPYGPMRQSVWTPVLAVVGVILLGALISLVVQRAIVAQAVAQIEQSQKQTDELQSRIARSMTDLEEHALGTLQALASAVDAKDSYTAQHALNVAEYATTLCQHLSDCDKDLVEQAALLHDIGKIGIDDAILMKSAALTPLEFKVITEHPGIGANIIETVPFLQHVVPVVRHHHERWDGQGYPDGLTGTDIPWLARVLAVADAFDAMTSDRPYRRAMTMADARQEIIRSRGIQFDPEVADAFIRAIDTGEITVRSNG